MNTTSLKLIFRGWWRNKTFAIISLLSLAVGIACTNLLMAYVIYESDIESGSPNKNRIIYMAQDFQMSSKLKISYVAGDIPPMLKDRYPEVEDYLRLNVAIITIKDTENKYPAIDMTCLTSDASLPRFFNYEIVNGDLAKALTEPGKVALSEEFAQKLFGKDDPIGKMIPGTYQHTEDKIQYEVAAVLKDHPQSYLKFDAVTGVPPDFYGGTSLLLVNDKFRIDTFSDRLTRDKIPTFQMPDLKGEAGKYYFYTLQESYFQFQEYPQEFIPYINRNQKSLLYLGLFSALLILVIACLNYVNLSFSRISRQVKMIYTQKVMGSSAGQIYGQLFMDTFLTVLIAFLLSLLITLDLLPFFNRIVGGRLTVSFFFSPHVLPAIIGFILFLSVIPALYMSHKITGLSQSGFRDFASGPGKGRLIAALSIAQFSISIGLVFATLTVRDQLDIAHVNGERYRNLIEVGNFMGNKPDVMPLFAKEIERYPGIGEITLSNSSLLHYGIRQVISKNEDGTERSHLVGELWGDSTFLDFMRIPIVGGLPADQAARQYSKPVYISKQYAKLFIPKGENPVGKPLRLYDTDYQERGPENDSFSTIAGVVDDIYTGSLRDEVSPFLIYLQDFQKYSNVHIRLNDDNKEETMALLEKTWQKVSPDEDFSYIDLYAQFINQNKKTIEFADLLALYSVISLILTASGLFGIALYATERRTKEIGLRKINGASIPQVICLLNRQFLYWVAIAFLIAAPVTWYILQRWLENFVYRTHLSLWICLLSGGIVLAITLLTVSRHSYKAASRNPVKALRSE